MEYSTYNKFHIYINSNEKSWDIATKEYLTSDQDKVIISN